MDKRQIIGVGLLTVGLLLGYFWLKSYIDTKWPVPPPGQANTGEVAQTQPATTQAAGTQPTTDPTTGVAATSPAAPSVRPSGFAVVPTSQPSQGAVLGSAAENDGTWAMQLVVDPHGAALDSVTLNRFKDPADFKKLPRDRRPYIFQQGIGPGDYQPLSTRAVIVNGQTISLGGVVWQFESADTSSATYSVTLADAEGQPALKIGKTYRIKPRSDATQGYEVNVRTSFQNLSGQPLTVRESFDGPGMPPRELTRGADRQVLVGYLDDAHQQIDVTPHPVEEFKPDHATVPLATNPTGQPAGWVGAASVYFAAIVNPTPGEGGAPARYLANVTATGHDLADAAVQVEDKPVTLTFDTADLSLKPGQTAALPMNVYLGPRWRKVLDEPYYSSYPTNFNAILVVKAGFCASYCTFTPLIGAMVWLLAKFWWIAGGFAGNGSWGLAIIMLVCVVRLILHPITKRSQVQMMKMGKMGPEMEKLKKKYGDNKEELNKAMMQFYKEQGFAPILGCLPMFLQTPIWIALYSALQTTFELRQAPFLWNATWIHDLAKPDYLIKFSHFVPVPVIGWIFPSWQFDGINVLPVLLAVIFWINTKYQPKPAAVTPEQQQQQKMMQWMTLLFPLFLYSGPSGLNLYILTSTSIGIVENKIIRRHVKEREEQEKQGLVIVDADPDDAGRNGGARKPVRGPRNEGPPKRGGLSGWLANLQDKVEQARTQGERQARKKKQ